MAEIIKYNVYLNEQQARKAEMLAAAKGYELEEIINNAVYGYLAIADPLAEDKEPPQNQHEILFYISEDDAQQLMNAIGTDNYDDLDDYAKSVLLHVMHSAAKPNKE